MKKMFLVALMLILMVVLCSCNRTLIDTTYNFDRAQICLPDGSIVEGKVERWTDYEDGDQLQIRIGGISYLVHAENAVLIAE